jgi:8-oxo-dGTP diphosphatase
MDIDDVRPLAADGVVVQDGDVLLLQRDHPPHEGQWVLPGGFVDPGERAREAAEREVREEVGLDVEATAFVGLYDDPDRDERGTVSAAYRCRPVADDPSPEAVEEARQVAWFDPEELPELGFDHADIVGDALG